MNLTVSPLSIQVRKPSCIHNPATGREQELPQTVAKADTASRQVAVIGGGPAGLEAARVCAERGHRVTLFEAASKLGGQLLLASKATWRRDIITEATEEKMNSSLLPLLPPVQFSRAKHRDARSNIRSTHKNFQDFFPNDVQSCFDATYPF